MSDRKAIFHKRYDHDRRPKQGVTISVQPSEEPQTYPADVVQGAIKAGAATAHKSKAKSKSEN